MAHGTLTVVNPATLIEVSVLAEHGLPDILKVAEKARQAQKCWVEVPIEERLALLHRLKRYLQKNHEELVKVIQSETGKVWEDAMVDVVSAAAEIYNLEKHGAEWMEENISPHPLLMNKSARVVHEPYPLVGVISPFNLPLAIPASDIFPALLLGSAVLWKPSEYTPLTALYVAKAMKEVGFPDDLLQVIIGRGDAGVAVCNYSDYVSFTGSSATGQKVLELCRSHGTPCSLEMSGKTPAIVMPDANLDRTAYGLVYGAFSNTGQYCKSCERIFVHELVFEQLLGKVLKITRQLRPGIDYGPLVTSFQRDIVANQVAEAITAGAELLQGGGPIPHKSGYWYVPTILTNVNVSMTVMYKETFGPVLPMTTFRNLDDVLRAANFSHLGLNASVFTQSKETFDYIASKLEVGNVVGNDAMINWFIPNAPQCGRKGSMLQVSGLERHGRTGLTRFGQAKTIVWHSYPSFGLPFLRNKELWWMPYRGLSRVALKTFLWAF